MKAIKYILPFIFLVLSFSLHFAHFLRGEKEILLIEQRKAQTRPSLDSDFKVKFENFINDQLIYRELFIQVKSIISYSIFGDSPFPDKVIKGEDGWLFFNQENNIEIYQGKESYFAAELDSVTHLLVQKNNWFQNHKMAFYLLITPSKVEIYDNYLPQVFKRPASSISKVEQLVNHLKTTTDLNVIWPKDYISSKSKKHITYHKYDSHWNTHGAFLAYEATIDKLNEAFPDIEKVSIDSINYKVQKKDDFDLLKLCNLQNYISKNVHVLDKIYGLTVDSINRPDYVGISINPSEFYITNCKTNLKALVFRDSYCNDLVPYLNQSFSATTYLWTPYIHSQIVEAENPDIVILQVTQRRISDLFIQNDAAISKY